MESATTRKVLSVLLGFVVVAILIAIAFSMGKLSSQETGISYLVLCVTAAIISTRIFSAAPPAVARESSEEYIDPALRRKVLNTVRRCKIAIVIMSLILIFASWETRGEPLIPRLVGTSANVAIIGLFLIVMRQQRAKLRR
jgi:hypothetical protein